MKKIPYPSLLVSLFPNDFIYIYSHMHSRTHTHTHTHTHTDMYIYIYNSELPLSFSVLEAQNILLCYPTLHNKMIVCLRIQDRCTVDSLFT